ncbi:MAG: hypothetical protein ABR527_07255 [Gemmatimonadota bacterium]
MIRSIAAIIGTGLLVVAAGCRRGGEEPPIVVEADTTRPAGADDAALSDSLPPVAEPEVIVIEEREVAPPEAQPDPLGSPSETGGLQERVGISPPPELEEPDAETDEAPDRFVLEAGTRLALELRTPLHSATIRVGDRFAARTMRSVTIEGHTALEPGALVEGRVAGVTRADDDQAGRIELDFRALVLPSGARLPLDAEIASIAGRPADTSGGPQPGQVIGGAAGGAGVGGVLGGRKGAVIGAVVGALGGVLMAGASDHEVVVPSGTPIDITLRESIEVPAP